MLGILKRPDVSISASIESQLDSQDSVQLCNLNERNDVNIRIANNGGTFSFLSE